MRYESKEDLPETLREVMPEEAQEIYIDAYHKAWDEYDEHQGGELDRDSVAHRQAMNAVETEYERDRKLGTWYKKGERPEELDEDEGLLDDISDTLPGI